MDLFICLESSTIEITSLRQVLQKILASYWNCKERSAVIPTLRETKSLHFENIVPLRMIGHLSNGHFDADRWWCQWTWVDIKFTENLFNILLRSKGNVNADGWMCERGSFFQNRHTENNDGLDQATRTSKSLVIHLS